MCNGFASVGGTWHDGIGSFPYTLNGSFILPNGVIVLEEADMEAYLNGTLVFIYPNDGIARSSVTPYLKKKSKNHLIDLDKRKYSKEDIILVKMIVMFFTAILHF